ncbi:MAG: glycosyltransferase [Moorea sp. SIO2I5]|nr:glycosyltransferase [Moorena sp. SIO2I5]
MKVLHLNNNSSGGSFEFSKILADALVKQGVQSQMLCKSSEPTTGIRGLADRLLRRTYVSCSHTAWHSTWRLLQSPSSDDLQGIDIVHLHTVGDWFDVPSWLLALPKHIGVVVSLHDLWHVSGGCFIYRGCEQLSQNCQRCPILKFPGNRILATNEQKRKLRAYQNRKAPIVANSQWLATIAAQSPIAKACGGVKVIPPAISTDIFKPQDKQLCRQQWQIPLKKFVILTGCASLTDDNKNTLWLLKQLAKLPNQHDILVIAFGEGVLPIPVGLDVRFVGGIRDRLRLAQLMAAADVFVSASKMETYGLTLVEAMACGTPVVAFKVGGIPEAAPEEYGARLVPLEDSEAMLSEISKLKKSCHQTSKKVNQASDLIRLRNCPDNFAKAYLGLYQKCLDEINCI